MKKDYVYIIGLVIVASIFTVYLFSLPKEVLKEKNRQLETGATTVENEGKTSESDHFSFTPEQEEKIKKIRTLFITFSEKEKKLIFADSLVQAYLEVAHLDSALYYICLLYTSPSPRDGATSRMPSSA